MSKDDQAAHSVECVVQLAGSVALDHTSNSLEEMDAITRRARLIHASFVEQTTNQGGSVSFDFDNANGVLIYALVRTNERCKLSRCHLTQEGMTSYSSILLFCDSCEEQLHRLTKTTVRANHVKIN